jgi:hypothetical protein
MRYTLLASVGAVALGFASPAMAGGNIALTGHDDDFHCTYAPSYHGAGIGPCQQLGALASFVRNGSSLPVLAIDDGSELTGALGGQIGAGNVVSVPVSAVTAGMFNHSIYSAFAVASVTSCGGCDNPTGTGTALSAYSAAIDAFFNAGGGILGLTGAGDPNAFAYVPDAAAGVPIFQSSGFVATPAGLADIPGFDTVNGDETHNIFTSYTGYTVAEIEPDDGNAPVTIFIKNGSISCTANNSCTIHGAPEPFSLSLLGVGLFGLGMARRFRR